MNQSFSSARWKSTAIEELCRRIRRSWRATGSKLQLRDEILRRFENGLDPVTVPEASELLGKTPEDTAQVAGDLRKEIEALSRRDFPELEIKLTEKVYMLQVNGEPPDGWSQIRKSIGLLVANGQQWFVGSLIAGVLEVCRPAGYELIVETSNDRLRSEDECLVNLEKNVAGILVVPSEDHLKMTSAAIVRRKPCVLVDRYIPGIKDIPAVHHNDYAAGRRAGEYLYGQGCTRVIIIKHKSDSKVEQVITPTRDRQVGCIESLESHRMDPIPWQAGGFEEAGGYFGLKAFDEQYGLAQGDGIFAVTDGIALGCMKYLRTRANHLPKIPMIGFEGRLFGQYLEPPLTSILADPQEMGKISARVLLGTMGVGGYQVPTPSSGQHYLVAPKFLLGVIGEIQREEEDVPLADSIEYYLNK